MRIGLDVTPLGGQRTGIGRYVQQVVEHLATMEEGDTLHGLSTGAVAFDAGGVPGLASHRHLPLPTRAMYQIWNGLKRPRADTLLGGVDVFHATNYFLPPLKSARSVVTVHDLAFLRNPEWGSPKIVKTFSNNMRRFAQRADAIAACSDATKRDVIELLDVDEEKVAVVYEAADDGFDPVDPKEAGEDLARYYGIESPFLLFVSTIEPRKNVDGLLHAFARIQQKIPHHLVLVGKSGWCETTAMDMIRNLGLRDRVLPIGFVSHPDLLKLYSATDAFVFPSFYEGFGLPVLEAMRCGAPVITSSTSSLPEVGGDAAEYVDPNDINGLAETIERVALDSELRTSLRERGLAQARQFSWAECARQTHELYRSIL